MVLRSAISFCFFLLSQVISTDSAAQSDVNLVSGNDYAPFTDQSLPQGGLATAVVSEAFNQIGLKTAIDWKPWKRGFLETKEGRYIGTFPYIPTDERKQDFLYSAPVFTETYVALSNAKDKNNYLSYEDMKGRTICRPVGYAIADKIESNLENWNISLFQPRDMAGCMRAIMNLPNHVVILNRLQAAEELKKPENDLSLIKIHPIKEQGFTLHFIVSKKRQDAHVWINRFNDGLKKVKQSGSYARLMEKFGLQPTMMASQ